MATSSSSTISISPINKGDIFIIMGGSGCGKSTLLRHLVGLQAPARGRVLFSGESLWEAEPERRDAILRKTGVTYQAGGLWSSMTLAENVALPLEQYTDLKPAEIADLASLNLALVGLAGFEDYFPSRDQRGNAEARRPRPSNGAVAGGTAV